jgi:heptosyltransferase-1
LIFDFQGLLKSGVLIGLAKGNRKIGFDRGMEHAEQSHLFLNDRVPPVDMEIHALTRGMMLFNTALCIRDKEIVYNLPVSEVHREIAEKLLARNGIKQINPLVTIHPMAKWDTKLWSNKKFSELADRLIEQYDVDVVFTGSQGDRATIQDIVSGMKRKAVNLAGETSIIGLAALYEKSDFLVSTDTGPMHLAAAVGTPVVALFGPTAPWRTGPFGPGHKIVRVLGLTCSPCFKRTCETNGTECMERIFVDDVLKEIQGLGII